MPNPNPYGVAIKLGGNCDRVTLRLWSVGFQLLQSIASGPAPAGWSTVALPWDALRRLPNGTYYVTVDIQRAGLHAYSRPAKFLLLR